jgi:hypothetical protein
MNDARLIHVNPSTTLLFELVRDRLRGTRHPEQQWRFVLVTAWYAKMVPATFKKVKSKIY